MPGKSHIGKAGHLAAMAEFLLRGYNVAMPEVDLGDDIFVVEDLSGELWRIQVKTAVGKVRDYGHNGRFAVGLKQLQAKKTPELWYVFALRAGDRWEFVLIPRKVLSDEHDSHSLGPVSRENVILNLRFTESAVRCAGRDFQDRRNNWREWPVIA